MAREGDDWVLEWEAIDPEEFAGETIPDIAIDPDESTLSLCNIDTEYKVAYISVFGTKLIDKSGSLLDQSITTSTEKDTTSEETTLIVLCPSKTFCHLCFIESLPSLHIESDVQVWKAHPDPSDTASRTIAFPFPPGNGFRCTQSENATLTHFFVGNHHAIDFACPVGTPFVAVGNGVVEAVQTDHSHVTGIGVQNMFRWNSLLLRLNNDPEQSDLLLEDNDGLDAHHTLRDSAPLFVEYVHIDTAEVHVGDVVQVGDVLGTTGAAGFCPTPHLHISTFRTEEDTAPTCRVYFRGRDGRIFLPQAGKSYNLDGVVPCTRET